MPDREALTGFAMLSVPVVMLCQGTNSVFLLRAAIAGGSVVSLLHGPMWDCHRPGEVRVLGVYVGACAGHQQNRAGSCVQKIAPYQICRLPLQKMLVGGAAPSTNDQQ